MARVQYKGFDLPDGAAIPDVPADLRTMVDSGPIPRFATAAARDTALGTPPAGVMCWVTDTATLQVFNGTVWVVMIGRAFARMRAGAGQSIPGQTITLLTGMTADLLRGGMVFANNTIVVPRAGYYRVSAQATMSLSVVISSGNPTVWCYVYRNGAGITAPDGPLHSAQVAGQIVNGTTQSVPFTKAVPLNAGDALDLRVQQTHTANLNSAGNMSWLDVEEMGIAL